MSKIINWYPDAPNEWLWRNHDMNVKREFFPSVSIRYEDMPEWHECEPNYKGGYDLLWSLRQEERTDEDRQSLESQYAAWQSSNPALAEEIDHAVPEKPAGLEPEQASEQAPEQESDQEQP